MKSIHLLLPAILPALASSAIAQVSIPSVIVTVENAQPSRGMFLTPPWMGIHDGTFDSYDGGSPASMPLGGNEIEALAEDGNNGPITATFDALLPMAPQIQGLAGPGGPLAPGDRAAVTFNVNPTADRFFSYGSMIIPSNDAFIANGNPTAHELFDAAGNFVGAEFIVSGDETNDAGTEVNDEIAANVAFLAQAGPNIGDTEGSTVQTPSSGFAAPGTLSFPNGVLNYPVFANGDFNDADDRLFSVKFRFVDLGGQTRFGSILGPDQEVQADPVDSNGIAGARLRSFDAQQLVIGLRYLDLTGPLQAAHLHVGQAGTNGGVVVDLGQAISPGRERQRHPATDPDRGGPHRFPGGRAAALAAQRNGCRQRLHQPAHRPVPRG